MRKAVVMSDANPNGISIRVLLVDDHAIVRQGLRYALEAYPNIEVVGEASNGEEAVASVGKVQPTVVVMDIVMPKMDGIAATRLIKTQYPQIAVVGLTSELKDYTLYSMKKAGASEVLNKKYAVVELHDAIQRALAGIEKVMDPPEIGHVPQNRRIGIAGVDRLAWGEHLCVFFYNKTELLRLTVPYIKAGLEDGECCIWITGEPVNEVEAFEALKQALPNAADYLAHKQLEIIACSSWYLVSGVFDGDTVLENWLSKASHAKTQGFAGLRITGNPFWLRTENEWSQFGGYELAVTDAIRYKQIIALCTYPGPICPGDNIDRVLSTHRSALFVENDHWQHLILTP
jgi:CheY-like chemotaxis protein